MTDFPDVKLKALVNFPSNAIGGTGIDVANVAGNFVVDLSYSDFVPPVGGVSDPANQTILLWNAATSQYSLTPISLFGGGGGIPDAPNDGVQYGRQGAAWTPIAGISGFAPLASPAFTGNPTAPTPTAGDNDTSIATTAFVAAAVSASGGVTPSALTRTNDTNVTLTLGGTPATALLQATSITVGWSGALSAARGGFGADVSAQSGVPLFAAGVPTFTATTGSGIFARAIDPVLGGNPTAPTPAAANNTASIANTNFIYLSSVRYDMGQSLTGPQQAQGRSNIAAATAGANSDITSLAGLTTPLSVAQGGTGDSGTAWTSYTPTANMSSGAATATGRYKAIGKTIIISVNVTITTGGTLQSVSLPAGVTSAATGYVILLGRENAVTGTILYGLLPNGSNTIACSNLAVTSGWIISYSGSFERV